MVDCKLNVTRNICKRYDPMCLCLITDPNENCADEILKVISLKNWIKIERWWKVFFRALKQRMIWVMSTKIVDDAYDVNRTVTA